MDITYWEQYYEKNPIAFDASDFATSIVKYINNNETVLDMGCGNGRDSIYLADSGINVIGIDQCESQITRLNNTFKNNSNLTFITGDFTHMDSSNYKIDHAYSRFTLHSIDEISENTVIKWVSDNISKYFFIETRSNKDKLNGVKTDHYRRFISINKLLKKLIDHEFEIEYAELSNNFSKYNAKYNVDYNEDDPILIRIIAKKI